MTLALSISHDPHLLESAKKVASARRAQASILPPWLLGDPSLDILIESYIAGSEQRDLPLTEACNIATGGTPAITLRWVALLVDRGLLERTDRQSGGRCRSIRLTAHGMDLVTRCLQAQRTAHLQALR